MRQPRGTRDRLLDAALRLFAERGYRLELLPLGDVRAELVLVARWALAEVERQGDLLGIILKDGRELPELVDRVRDAIVRRGYADAAAHVGARLEDAGVQGVDPAAVAAIGLGAIVNYRLVEAVFGEPPGGVDEERFVQTWVTTWLALLGPSKEGRDDGT